MGLSDSNFPQESPFRDLPAALIEEMLTEATPIAETLLNTFHGLQAERTQLRHALEHQGVLLHESVLGYPPLPTTCGIDGSYAIERLLSIDLVACAAVAVEGLTPPSETRHWEQPHYRLFIRPETHDTDTATVLRAMMVGYELHLATRAPHDVVFLDGTLTLPIIYFNQALHKASTAPTLSVAQEFLARALEFLQAYYEILQPKRHDKCYVGLPKYTTRREIGRMLGWPPQQDDRGLLTFLLNAGELTKPIPLEQPRQPWHLTTAPLDRQHRALAEHYAQQVTAALQQIRILYYKPHQWLPAVRLELPATLAESAPHLALVIQAIKYQCATPGMLEPYPLYLADRTVKAFSRALPAFRQVATQHLNERYTGDILDIFFGMHGYRSESGI